MAAWLPTLKAVLLLIDCPRLNHSFDFTHMAHRSNTELTAYLATCPAEVLFDLSQILGDRLGLNGMRKRFQSPSDIPSGENRQLLANDLVAELGYFGSNSIAYLTRRIMKSEKAVGYHEVLYEAAAYLEAVIEDGDQAALMLALRQVAQAQGGIAEIARKAKLTREATYKMLSKSGNPELRSLNALLRATGLRIAVRPIEKRAA
jgi:probable addiction module antidote protein